MGLSETPALIVPLALLAALIFGFPELGLVLCLVIGSLIYRGIRVSRITEQPFHSLSLETVVPLIVFLVAGLFSMSIIGTRPLWFVGGVILSLHRLFINDRGKANSSY